MEKREFGSRLRELRGRAGLSQRELADRLGVDFSYLSKIENGVMPAPSEEVILKLAEVLKADRDELLTLAGRVPSDIAQILKNREVWQSLRENSTEKKPMATNKRDSFNKRLKELREQTGLSQRELADKVGINFTYLSKIESGVKPPPSEKVILKLAEALNGDKDELMTSAGKIPSDITRILKSREVRQSLREGRTQKMMSAAGNRKGISIMEYIMKGKQLARTALAIVLVGAIAASLWFASPLQVKALRIDITNPQGAALNPATHGQTYYFQTKVSIENGEFLPIQNVDLSIFNSANASGYRADVTNLPLKDGGSANYTTGGGSVNITATAVNWNYVYSENGSVSWNGTIYPFGYGYGYGIGPSSITYTVAWTPPSGWPVGGYKIETKITTQERTFTQLSSEFTLSAALVSVAVTPSNPSITLGATKQFSATGTYTDASTANITATANWTSSNTSVATIGLNTGLATSVAPGTTTITATSGSISGNTTLTVTAANLASIAVTPSNPSIALGLTQQFSAVGTYTDATTANITTTANWTSSNTSVATIGLNTGLATSVAPGTTTITATSGSINGTTTLTVTPATLVSIAVTPPNPSITLGSTRQFNATGTYTDASTANITATANWTSSNTSVATIGLNTGLATSVAPGTTTITATSGTVSRGTTLTVTPVGLVSIAVTPPNPSITVGATKQFNATGTYTDASTANLTATANWTSSNTSVATIGLNTGLATSVAPGTTTITATSGSISGNTTLTVTPVGLVAETSIAQGLSSNVTVVKVNINRIKNPTDNTTANITGGIGSYTATVSGNLSSAIQFLAVNGVSPFDSPSFNAATGVFSVAVVASPIQASNTTVAEVVPILTGNTTTNVTLTVAFQAIGAAGQPGLTVPEERSNSIILLRGDADMNGVISVVDSLAIKQYLVGQLTLSQINPLNAAAPNHDGAGGDKISIVDALAVEQFLVGQINAYYQ